MCAAKQFDKSDLQIIRSIQLLDQPTRQSISDEVGLSLQKVSKVLKRLESITTIRKAGKSFSASGRPSFIYELAPKEMHTIGASINNRGMTIVAIDATKEVVNIKELQFSEKALRADDSALLIDEIIAPLKAMKAELTIAGSAPSAIGISVPGMVDTARRVWLSGLQLPGINHVDINKEICKRMDIPVYVEDNSRIISYFEKVRGRAKHIDNFVVLYLGIGVGAGIIINNEIYRGSNGTAGEIGHIIHHNNNYRCSCGNVGCLETVTSESGVIRVFKDRLAEGVHSLLKQVNNYEENLTLEAILEAAKVGDKLSRTTLFEIGQFIGDAATILINLFNPQKLFITGTVAIFEHFLKDAIMLSLNRKIFPSILERTEIEFTPYSAINEAHGSSLFALSQYWDESLSSNGKSSNNGWGSNS